MYARAVIHRSRQPDVPLPEVDFSTFVLDKPRMLAGKVALIDAVRGTQLTFGELTEHIDATAAGLAEQGLQSGQTAAICGFNTIDYAVAAHAVWRAGAVVVTMNPLFTAREMREELADSGASLVLAATEVMDRVGEAGAERLIPLDALPRASRTLPAARVQPDETALILYSSGTTGLPKGVMLTHRNLIASVQQLEAGDLSREDDRLIAISPFFHVVGLHGILNLGLYTGAGIVLLQRYELRRFLAAVQEHRVSSAFLIPPVLLDVAKNPAVKDFDLSSLRSILCAAAPLAPQVEQECAEILGCIVKQGWGMTEACGPATTVLNDNIRRGSVGPPVPNTECKVVDPVSGRELGPGETGELLIRGPQVMKGYLNQPEATADTLEPDGWLHTGDLGYGDEDGCLYIVDRLKEVIKYKAYQVAPAELEAVLLSHPAVADAAVIPRPDEDAGEIPKAFVVLRSAVDEQELLAFVAERVAPYKKIRALELTDAIPKSPSGKILRRVLIERERAGVSSALEG